MNDLIKIFHIDWKLLIAQVVNFIIVLLVLGIFALKPLTKIMKNREDRIKRGIKDAEEMEQKLKDIEKEREQKIKEGRREAQEIINKAEKLSEAARKGKIDKSLREAEKIIVEARGQIREERDLMVHDVKKELGGIIGLALNKVTSEVIDNKDHRKLIDDTIDKIDNDEKETKRKK